MASYAFFDDLSSLVGVKRPSAPTGLVQIPRPKLGASTTSTNKPIIISTTSAPLNQSIMEDTEDEDIVLEADLLAMLDDLPAVAQARETAGRKPNGFRLKMAQY